MYSGSSLYGILCFILIALALYGTGLRLSRLLGFESHTLPGRLAVAFGAGAAIYIILIQVVGRLSLLNGYVLWGLILLGLVFGGRALMQAARDIRLSFADVKRLGAIQLIIAMIIVIYLAAFFIAALAPMIALRMPENADEPRIAFFARTSRPMMENDADAFHYAQPARYLRAGKRIDIPDSPFSTYPLAYESLVLLSMGTGGEVAANLLNWLFAVNILMLFMDIGAKHKSSEAALTMGILLIGIDSFHKLILPGYIDLSLVFYAVGAFQALHEYLTDPKPGHAIRTGLFLGLLIATKYNGLLLWAYICAILLIKALASRKRALILGHLGLVLIVSGILALPFEGVNAIRYGNPTYPFLNEFFNGRPAPMADDIDTWTTERPDEPTLAGALGYLPALCFNTRVYNYFSPAFILLPVILIIFLRRREIAIPSGYAVIQIIFGYILMPTQDRYLLPAVGAIIYVIGLAVASIRGQSIRRIALAILAIPFLLQVIHPVEEAARRFPVALGFENRKEFITSNDRFFELVFELNETAREDETVWFVARKGYRLDRNYVYWFKHVPDHWERNTRQYWEILSDNDIAWILVSGTPDRPPDYNYIELMGGIDAAIFAMKKAVAKGSIDWMEIKWEADRRNVPHDIVKGFARAIGLEEKDDSTWEFNVESYEKMSMKWPNFELYAAIVSALPKMAEEGYVKLQMDNGTGRLYKVIVDPGRKKSKPPS